nr:toprim domain-containing protein [Kribbella sp. VKM Ac-2500]
MNTSTTPIYEKSKTLVGLGEQRKLLARGGIPVLVEGPTDALAVDRLSRLTRCGWAGVAGAGTRLSVEQSNLLSHRATSDIVIVATDGDAAGRSAAIRWLGPLSAVFRDVLCAELPAGHDPSSLFASEYGADRLSRALSFARPLVDVAIDTELSRWSRVLDHISGRVNALRAVLPLVTKMPKDRVAAEVIRLSRLLQQPRRCRRAVCRGRARLAASASWGARRRPAFSASARGFNTKSSRCTRAASALSLPKATTFISSTDTTPPTDRRRHGEKDRRSQRHQRFARLWLISSATARAPALGYDA